MKSSRMQMTSRKTDILKMVGCVCVCTRRQSFNEGMLFQTKHCLIWSENMETHNELPCQKIEN